MKYKKFIENAKNDRMLQAVITTAALLLEESPENIKMTDIADKCEIGVASLYRYFGTKSGIVIKAACVLWQDVRGLFDGVFECDYYRDKTGIESLKELMKVFKVLYMSHKDFLRFLDSFDRFVVSEGVTPDELKEYEQSVLDFYSLFEDAYRKGCEDGTVRTDIDFRTMYLSVTHSLMLMSEKFARGGIFENENVNDESELDFIIAMAIDYIAA